MKKKAKAPGRWQKGEKLQAAGGEQNAEGGSETAAQRPKGDRKPKGKQLKKVNKTRVEDGKEKSKIGSNSSGAKLKK